MVQATPGRETDPVKRLFLVDDLARSIDETAQTHKSKVAFLSDAEHHFGW